MTTEYESKPHKKPTNYDELFPGRFMKAGLLNGKKPTLTIADVDIEDLPGEDGKPKTKCIVSFRETKLALVTCKTNGICLKAMFGPQLANWIGKRIVLFADTWNGEPCLRIWGSPDIEADMVVDVTLPRRRPFKKSLRKTGTKGAKQEPAPTIIDEETGEVIE
jgi:hypothetical protein